MGKRRDGAVRRRLATGVSLAATWLRSGLGSIGAAVARSGGGASPTGRYVLAEAIARREGWRRSREAVLRDDFGEAGHFRGANAALLAPAPGEKRVVFVGDSITAGWMLDRFFPGKGYINRGISGQTTSQVLVRFRQDVINLRPAAVVILIGTNDIAGMTGPIALADIQGNVACLAELAGVHRIAVALASVLPVHGYTLESAASLPLRAPERIVALNRWMAGYAAEHGHAFIDYFAAMVDERGLLKKELADDGRHPNYAGYAIMAAVAETALGKILGDAPAPPAARDGLR